MPPDYCDPCHPWTTFRISRGNLFVVDIKNSNMGLKFPMEPGEVTPFIRIPWKASLEITWMENFEESFSFSASPKVGYLAPKNIQNGVCGRSCLVNGIIVVLGRNPFVMNLKYVKYHTTMIKWIWGIGIGLLIFKKRSERAYRSFIDTVKNWKVNHAHQLIWFKTMASSEKESWIKITIVIILNLLPLVSMWTFCPYWWRWYIFCSIFPPSWSPRQTQREYSCILIFYSPGNDSSTSCQKCPNF